MIAEIEMGVVPFGILAGIAGVAMLHPRGRRAVYILMRYGKAHMATWMATTMVICAFIPGPFDEILVFPILVILTLRTKRNRVILRRYLRRI